VVGAVAIKPASVHLRFVAFGDTVLDQAVARRWLDIVASLWE
jgi:hypothetical protein